MSSTKAKGVENDAEEVKSTPVTKRVAAKRTLASETTEAQTKEADSKKGIVNPHTHPFYFRSHLKFLFHFSQRFRGIQRWRSCPRRFEARR